MKTFIARVMFLFAGVLPAFVFIPVVRGEVPIFYGGYTQLSATAQGSYVFWGRQSPPFDFERLPETTVGQVWEGDGLNHTVNYFDIYRAFVVFDVPRYKGIVTRDEIGIPDGVVPDVTLLRTKVTRAGLNFQPILEDELGYDRNPIELRMASLPASALIDGLIDPEVAFNGLLSGPRLDTELIHALDSPASMILDDRFNDFLNHTDGGPVVFSFTMPLYDHRGELDLKYLEAGMELTVEYDGYAPMSPVPEPATYACAGALMCAMLAARRTIKARRAGP